MTPLLLTMLVVAHVAGAPPRTSGQSNLEQRGLPGTAWNAVELSGMPVPPFSAPERAPHLVFAADGKVSGSDGCNRLVGSYTVQGEAITFGQIAGTRMACPQTEAITRRFLAALNGTSRWRIAGGRLEFYGATGKPLAVFERRTAPPAGGEGVPQEPRRNW